jgi:hypothetical protein
MPYEEPTDRAFVEDQPLFSQLSAQLLDHDIRRRFEHG